MNEWIEHKLIDLCVKIGSGATPRGGGESYKETGISLIRSQNVLDFQFSESGLAFIDNEQAHELKNVIVKENDVLLNITGDSVARVCKVPIKVLPARVNQHVAIVRSDSQKLNSDFLLYYLQSIKDRLLSISEIGATRRALTKGMIENLKIIVPDLREQTSIASILSSLDDKIDLLHRQNKTLEQMAETLFRQWFVEEAEEDWEVLPLGSLCTISSGKSLKKDYFDDNGLYPVLGANGVIGRTNHFLFDDKLIYTGRVGTLGKIFRVENQKVWLSDNTLIFHTPDYYNFIYFTLKNLRLSNYNAGSTQPLIRQSDIKAIEIIIPPISSLLNFEASVTPLFYKVFKNIIQINTLENLRNTLLPKLITGEVNLKK